MQTRTTRLWPDADNAARCQHSTGQRIALTTWIDYLQSLLQGLSAEEQRSATIIPGAEPIMYERHVSDAEIAQTRMAIIERFLLLAGDHGLTAEQVADLRAAWRAV